MNISIKYNYEICYLPTSRHKKERKACMEDVIMYADNHLRKPNFHLGNSIAEMKVRQKSLSDISDGFFSK